MSNNAIFLPSKIKVGYQNRSDTYTKKLAYVIYYDNKNVLRKETSWEGWRDKKIEANDFDNTPLEGFVLNKKAGGYSSGWNHRQAYCRVYDPRGFEFEITIENLLFILDNTNSIKGKGLEGKFVYGWQGGDLILIPEDCPDYKEITSYNENLTKKVKKKDLVPGKVYLNKSNQKVIYLGHFDRYETYNYKDEGYRNYGKRFFFINFPVTNAENISNYSFNTQSSLSNIMLETDDQCENYAEIMDRLAYNPEYSAYDENQFIYEEVEYLIDKHVSYSYYINYNGKYHTVNINWNNNWYGNNRNKNFYLHHYSSNGYTAIDGNTFESKEELIKNYKFYKQIKVLTNGKIAK